MMNNASVNIGVHLNFNILLSILLDKYPEGRLLNHTVALLLIFWRTIILFSLAATPLYILANRVQGVNFSIASPKLNTIFFVITATSWASQVALSKEPVCQCRRHENHGFNSWVGTIPWRRAWLHSSILAWRVPWTEEPGGLQSMGSQRLGHNWRDLAHTHTATSQLWGDASLGLWFVWPWRLVMLNILSNTRWPFLCLL